MASEPKKSRISPLLSSISALTLREEIKNKEINVCVFDITRNLTEALEEKVKSELKLEQVKRLTPVQIRKDLTKSEDQTIIICGTTLPPIPTTENVFVMGEQILAEILAHPELKIKKSDLPALSRTFESKSVVLVRVNTETGTLEPIKTDKEEDSVITAHSGVPSCSITDGAATILVLNNATQSALQDMDQQKRRNLILTLLQRILTGVRLVSSKVIEDLSCCSYEPLDKYMINIVSGRRWFILSNLNAEMKKNIRDLILRHNGVVCGEITASVILIGSNEDVSEEEAETMRKEENFEVLNPDVLFIYFKMLNGEIDEWMRGDVCLYPRNVIKLSTPVKVFLDRELPNEEAKAIKKKTATSKFEFLENWKASHIIVSPHFVDELDGYGRMVTGNCFMKCFVPNGSLHCDVALHKPLKRKSIQISELSKKLNLTAVQNIRNAREKLFAQQICAAIGLEKPIGSATYEKQSVIIWDGRHTVDSLYEFVADPFLHIMMGEQLVRLYNDLIDENFSDITRYYSNKNWVQEKIRDISDDVTRVSKHSHKQNIAAAVPLLNETYTRNAIAWRRICTMTYKVASEYDLAEAELENVLNRELDVFTYNVNNSSVWLNTDGIFYVRNQIPPLEIDQESIIFAMLMKTKEDPLKVAYRLTDKLEYHLKNELKLDCVSVFKKEGMCIIHVIDPVSGLKYGRISFVEKGQYMSVKLYSCVYNAVIKKTVLPLHLYSEAVTVVCNGSKDECVCSTLEAEATELRILSDRIIFRGVQQDQASFVSRLLQNGLTFVAVLCNGRDTTARTVHGDIKNAPAINITELYRECIRENDKCFENYKNNEQEVLSRLHCERCSSETTLGKLVGKGAKVYTSLGCSDCKERSVDLFFS